MPQNPNKRTTKQIIRDYNSKVKSYKEGRDKYETPYLQIGPLHLKGLGVGSPRLKGYGELNRQDKEEFKDSPKRANRVAEDPLYLIESAGFTIAAFGSALSSATGLPPVITTSALGAFIVGGTIQSAKSLKDNFKPLTPGADPDKLKKLRVQKEIQKVIETGDKPFVKLTPQQSADIKRRMPEVQVIDIEVSDEDFKGFFGPDNSVELDPRADGVEWIKQLDKSKGIEEVTRRHNKLIRQALSSSEPEGSVNLDRPRALKPQQNVLDTLGIKAKAQQPKPQPQPSQLDSSQNTYHPYISSDVHRGMYRGMSDEIYLQTVGSDNVEFLETYRQRYPNRSLRELTNGKVGQQVRKILNLPEPTTRADVVEEITRGNKPRKQFGPTSQMSSRLQIRAQMGEPDVNPIPEQTPQRFGLPGQQQIAGPEMPEQTASADPLRQASQEIVSDRINTQQVDFPDAASTDQSLLQQMQERQQMLQTDATRQITPQRELTVPTDRMRAPVVPDKPSVITKGGTLGFLPAKPKLPVAGATVGVLADAYNLETIGKLEQGDVVGATGDVAKGALVGAAIEQTAKRLGAQGALGIVATPVIGAGILTEGREGSTTDVLLDKYGSKIGMNQTKPSWGTEFGEMNTQKPGYVQATEDAIDNVINTGVGFAKGAIAFFNKPKPVQPAPAPMSVPPVRQKSFFDIAKANSTSPFADIRGQSTVLTDAVEATKAAEQMGRQERQRKQAIQQPSLFTPPPQPQTQTQTQTYTQTPPVVRRQRRTRSSALPQQIAPELSSAAQAQNQEYDRLRNNGQVKAAEELGRQIHKETFPHLYQ